MSSLTLIARRHVLDDVLPIEIRSPDMPRSTPCRGRPRAHRRGEETSRRESDRPVVTDDRIGSSLTWLPCALNRAARSGSTWNRYVAARDTAFVTLRHLAVRLRKPSMAVKLPGRQRFLRARNQPALRIASNLKLPPARGERCKAQLRTSTSAVPLHASGARCAVFDTRANWPGRVVLRKPPDVEAKTASRRRCPRNTRNCHRRRRETVCRSRRRAGIIGVPFRLISRPIASMTPEV